MTASKVPKFGVIQGGRANPEPMIRPPGTRLLEDEMRWARGKLREKLDRPPTEEEVRRYALELSAGKYGQQAREGDDIVPGETPDVS